MFNNSFSNPNDHDRTVHKKQISIILPANTYSFRVHVVLF